MSNVSKDKHKVCLIFRNINACSGQTFVAICMMKTLENRGFRTILFCKRKVDEDKILSNFGVKLSIGKEASFSPWPHVVPTYYEFALSMIAKSLCDVLVNPFTSDILPCDDITYIHYPKPRLLKEQEKSQFWSLYYKPYYALERSFASRDKRRLVLANSLFTAEVVKKEFKVDPIVLYPPVDLRPLTEIKKVTGKNLVVTISRISSEKGLERIPQVAEHVDAQFVVLGSLHNYKLYRKLLLAIRASKAKDKVTIIPDAPIGVKIDLLRRAKVYFHTAPLEHFGISIVEGMGAGCIPIVPNSGGPREFVPQPWRYNCEEEAVSKIRDALVSWSPAIGRDMSFAASKFSAKNFEIGFSNLLDHYLKERVK